MAQVIGLGEICIDWTIRVKRFPQADEKVYIVERKMLPGGVVANFTVGIAMLGASVAFIGGIGKDTHGKFLVNSLKKKGIDTRLTLLRSNPTAINIIIVDETGERQIYMDPYLKLNVPSFEEIKNGLDSMLAGAKVLHTSAIRLDTAILTARFAKRKGIKVTFDLEKHVAEEYGLKELKPLLELTDILMPNKMGLRTLMQMESIIEAAKEVMKYGPSTVVVTMGERGSLIVHEDKVIETSAFKIKPIDTTGAGDAFNAGFVYAYLILGLDLREASLVANAVAALKCMRLGAQAGMPKVEEVEKFLRERGYAVSLSCSSDPK
jgi:ribokinase